MQLLADTPYRSSSEDRPPKGGAHADANWLASDDAKAASKSPSVCVCVCVCVYVCTYVWVYVCVCECVITNDYSNGLLLSHQSTTNQRTEVQSTSIKGE